MTMFLSALLIQRELVLASLLGQVSLPVINLGEELRLDLMLSSKDHILLYLR